MGSADILLLKHALKRGEYVNIAALLVLWLAHVELPEICNAASLSQPVNQLAEHANMVDAVMAHTLLPVRVERLEACSVVILHLRVA
jgi:hypothetical protein